MGNQGLQSREKIISKFIEQSRKIEILNKTESPWHETGLFSNKDEGPVVLKTLKQITLDQDYQHLENEMKKKQKNFEPERRHPNVLLYHEASPTKVEQRTVLLRQYICYNLTEKIHWLPHLMSEIEKKWLVFLILCGVAQIHSEKQVHGDIKPENILVTSYDWLFIADMHTYKPVLIADDNLKEYNQFFGDLDNNIRCYTAPERWYSPIEKSDKTIDSELKPAMDIFSAGCVIAEILMNGLPLFDLARLQQYRRGLFDPTDELKKRIIGDDKKKEENKEDIGNRKMVELILKMISRDPKNRPNIIDCISEWNKNVFPSSFSKVLFQIGASFQQLSNLYSDNRISLIRYHIDSIFETCLGEFDAIETFKEPIEPAIFNLLQSSDLERRYDMLLPKIRQEFKFYSKSKDEDEMCARQTDIKGYEKDSLLIVVLWLGHMLQSCFYPQSRLVALEMIHRMSKYLRFQDRLNLVLPLVQLPLVEVVDNQAKRGSTSKVKVKALDVMLGLFYELEEANEKEIYIEALDYKVGSSYIMQIIKRLMDSSKNDQLIRLAVAMNVGRLARITARFLEVAISSCNRRRKEALLRRQETNVVSADQLMTTYGSMHVTHFGNFRTTFAQKREDLLAVEVINPNDIIEEDLIGPSYDGEMENVWKEIQQIIENTIGAKEQENNMIIAILQSSIELSQIFGVEKGDFLIQQCISGVNKKNFRVRQQALKTLGGLSFRVGEKKVEEYVLPLAEQLLEDPEDLIILEDLKMLNYLLLLRLISKKNCMKLVQNLTPYLLYPNQKIRLEVATYICHLFSGNAQKIKGEKGPRDNLEIIETSGVKIVISKKPLVSYEDFYCFIKPTLTAFVKECYQHEIMESVSDPEIFLKKLREPLNLKIMRAYFNQFARVGQNSQLERETFSLKEDKFTQRCAIELTPDDVFAFEILRGIFKQKLKQLTLKSEEKKQVEFDKQYPLATNFVYRVVKQNAVSKLATGFQINSGQSQSSDLTGDEKAKIIQQFTKDSERFFCLQNEVTTQTNFGLNQKQDLTLTSIPFEMGQILKSLEVIPQIPETNNFKNLKTRERGEISRLMRVNSEIKLAARGPQASIVDQFDGLTAKQTVAFKVLDEHRKEAQNIKGAGIPNFRPHGTLITTLYEHKSPVNTVTVSEDQSYFMTGSRGDKAVHVYSVKNIQEDFSASVVQINTESAVNQISMVQNSTTLAVATEKGIELHDFARLFAGALDDQYKTRHLNIDEVLQIQSMQTPISYQNILLSATSSGCMLLYDLRQRKHILKDEGVFVGQRGAVSAMCVGKDAFGLTVGTLGGYVATYDIRYGVTAALFKHHLNWPVLAMACYRKNDLKGSYFYNTMLSLGGPQHEMCQMNMETGQINVLYRINNQPTDQSAINKNEIISLPEFFRETQFKDNKFSTLKRDSNLRIFERSLLYLNQNRYDALNQIQGLQNIDSSFLHASELRFKRISESYTCPNACRSILIPRDNFQSMMFDNETADFAITAGNDRKIRYWNLYSPATLSYQINSPLDDEVSYAVEQINKSTTVVVEKLNSQKEFPKLTTARIKDQSSATPQQMQKAGGNYVWVKYAENTAYHNAIAAVAQGKHLATNSSGQSQAQSTQITDWNKFQTEEPQPNYMTVNTFNGLSQGQHLNNLAISPDPIEDSTDLRISDVVSHQDAILDMAICGDMLVTCGRDGLVKVWK